MRQRLLLGFLVFATIVVVILEVPLGLTQAANARATALTEVQNDGSSLGLVASAALDRGDVGGARAVLDRFARAEHAVVVVLAGRRVAIAAGKGAREELGDPATARIVRAARSGRSAGEEGSHDPDDDFLYAVVPVALRDPPAREDLEVGIGADTARLVLLVAEPASPLHAQISRETVRLFIFGGCLLALAACIGALLARSLTRPLARIEATVAAYGAGDLAVRVPPRDGPPELRTLGTTVNEMAQRLEDLLHAHRTFVADASHQLRTPLTALRLRLENLEGQSDQRTNEALSSAIAETDRLSHVIDGLLVLARSDGARPEREAVDVTSVVRDRIDAWGALAAERHVALAVAGATSAHAVARACPGHLEQILDNLLANALDATPPGGAVEVRVEPHDGDVEVHVVDTGPGLSAAERARAFDRFWRSDPSSSDGTGLGLAIVAQLVRVSGGSCWLAGGPTGGVDAIVRLAAST